MNRREFIAAAAGLPALAQLSIASSERDARKEKARRLMRDGGLSAIVMERGSSLFYFTGQSSGLWMLPAQGEPVLLPAGPDSYPKLAAAIRDRGMATAKIGIEERAAFALFDALRRDLPQANFASATPVTAGCRMIKSRAEIALLQRANDLTIAAYKAAFPRLREIGRAHV